MFSQLEMTVRNEVSSASGVPHAAFQWILKVEKVGITIDELQDSENFPSLDAKLAAALCRIGQGDLNHQFNTLMERPAKAGKMATGRQLLHMVYSYYRISEVDGALLDLEDLMNVRLHGDDLRSFLTDWENVLTTMAVQPQEMVLDTLFRKQLSRSAALKDQMSYYERLSIGHADRSYDFLLSIVRKRLEQQRRNRNRDELHQYAQER